jgi:hypothetical protein
MSNQYTASPLLDLPSELRLQIYQHFSPPLDNNMFYGSGIFLACKQLNAEVTDETIKNMTCYLTAITQEWDEQFKSPLITKYPTTVAEVMSGIEVSIPASIFCIAISDIRHTCKKLPRFPPALMKLVPLGVSVLTLTIHEDESSPSAGDSHPDNLDFDLIKHRARSYLPFSWDIVCLSNNSSSLLDASGTQYIYEGRWACDRLRLRFTPGSPIDPFDLPYFMYQRNAEYVILESHSKRTPDMQDEWDGVENPRVLYKTAGGDDSSLSELDRGDFRDEVPRMAIYWKAWRDGENISWIGKLPV